MFRTCCSAFNLLLASSAWASPDTSITAPVLKNQISPVYPAEALDKNSPEDVSVLVTVGVDGLPKKLEYESGSELFRASALEAAAKLRFEPATQNGAPVSATTRVYFHSPHLLSTALRWAVVLLSILKAPMPKSFTRTTLSEQQLMPKRARIFSDLTILPGVQKGQLNVKLQIVDLRTHRAETADSERWNPSRESKMGTRSCSGDRSI